MLRPKEIDEMLVELQSVMRSGVPLPEGLNNLAQTAPSPRVRKAAAAVASRLESGMSVAEAFENAKIGLPEHSLAMLRCGESADALAALMAHATEHSRRIRHHQQTLCTAFVYPAVVMIGVILLMTFIAWVVVPRAQEVFGMLNAELSDITVLAFATADFVVTLPGMIVLVLLLAIPVLLLVPRVTIKLLGAASSIPGLGGVLTTSDTILFSRYVSVMLSKGVPLNEALRATRNALTLNKSRRAVDAMARQAELGNPIARHMPGGTPSTAVYLIEQGEQRGDLATALENVADYCDQHFEIHTRRIAVVLEPFLLMVVAAILLTLILALYLPLFAIPRIMN